jgi:hypothetical protein
VDNYQAIGYMFYMFDIKTEAEAEKQGFEWYRNLEEQVNS